jgi:formate dehydrogenase subunit delta
MDIHHLVKMANDIGAFFESDPEPEKGAKGIAAHLRSFWDPRMRRELFSYLDRENGKGLNGLVLEALRSHRNEIDPTRYSASS